MPRLYPSVAQAVGKVLAKMTSTIVVFQWDMMKKHFRAIFGFLPEHVTDATEVAKANNVSPSLDAIAEFVTGGKYCRIIFRSIIGA